MPPLHLALTLMRGLFNKPQIFICIYPDERLCGGRGQVWSVHKRRSLVCLGRVTDNYMAEICPQASGNSYKGPTIVELPPIPGSNAKIAKTLSPVSAKAY